MGQITPQRLGRSLTAAAITAFAAACVADAPLGIDRTDVGLAPTSGIANVRAVDLGPCGGLQVEAGHGVSFRVRATGAQIYRWTGSAWAFVAPDAELFADDAGRGLVGSHYAGPTWESTSGSKVVAAVEKRCTPDASAIQWLLLRATSSQGPGIFDGTTFIQRLNTVGGIAPTTPGGTIGEEARVPYQTDYVFYRSQ